MAERIELPFGVGTRVATRNQLIDRDTYGRRLANTIERSVLSGDAGCRYLYFSNLLALYRVVWYYF